jgi:hypothetical protein
VPCTCYSECTQGTHQQQRSIDLDEHPKELAYKSNSVRFPCWLDEYKDQSAQENRGKKFVGNLTNTRIEVYARAAGATTAGNTNTRSVAIAPAVKEAAAGSIGFFSL